jgi:hypothetical protein
VRIGPGRFIRFEKVGSSDIEGILPGGRFLAEVQALGGLAVTVRGWRELDEVLREAGYVTNGPLFEGSNAAPYSGA